MLSSKDSANPRSGREPQPSLLGSEVNGQRCQCWWSRDTGSTWAQGLGNPRPLHTWPSCDLPETVIQALSLCHPQGGSLLSGVFPQNTPTPTQTSENQSRRLIKGQPCLSLLLLRVKAEVLIMTCQTQPDLAHPLLCIVSFHLLLGLSCPSRTGSNSSTPAIFPPQGLCTGCALCLGRGHH